VRPRQLPAELLRRALALQYARQWLLQQPDADLRAELRQPVQITPETANQQVCRLLIQVKPACRRFPFLLGIA